MRYKLNVDGYVESVAFGCYLDNCTEYTGEVPLGYNTLEDWATYACINAYYINSSGNLMLDVERLEVIRNKEAQDAVDNAYLVRKDLYETNTILDSQYVKATETGEVVILEDIKTITPRVCITGIEQSLYSKLNVYTQGKNMMPNDAITKEIGGITFTRNDVGSVTISGTATEDIAYSISGGSDKPIFALKKNHEYYLNLGGLNCELRLNDGETDLQQYIGASGLLNLDQSIEVSQVLIKIAKGETVNTTFFPQLEYGNVFTSYENYKSKSITIDFSDIETLGNLFPSDDLFPSDELFPSDGGTIDYILIEQGIVYASVGGAIRTIGNGNVGLYGDYNTIYATHDTALEITYSTSVYNVPSLEFLQGKATTSDYFKILLDGSIVVNNGYFKGKVEADSGYFKGKIEADEGYFKGKVEGAEIIGGTIKGTTISGATISGNTISGGTISIGSKFSVDITGKATVSDLVVTGNGSIDFAYGTNKMSLNYAGISFGDSSYYTSLTKEKLQIYNTFIDRDTVHCAKYSTPYSYYTDINGDEITLHGGTSSGYLQIKSSETTWASSTGTYSIKDNNGTVLASISVGKINIGGANQTLAFFKNAGSTRKSVAQLASNTTNISYVVTKLNNLIGALQAYGLIGG